MPRSQLTVYLQVVSDVNFFKQLGSRSGQHFVGLDLGSNCLQRLSADDINRDGGLVVRLRIKGSRVQILLGPSDFSEQKICPMFAPLHQGV